MEQRISLVTLGVADLDRARTFYERLGWKPAPIDAPDVVFFQAGGIVVGLWSRASLAAECGWAEPGERTAFGGIAISHNLRSPEEVDAVLAEAEKAGATVTRPAEPKEWGGYAGVFVDPDGHAWEIAHNPDWTIGPDGSITL